MAQLTYRDAVTCAMNLTRSGPRKDADRGLLHRGSEMAQLTHREAAARAMASPVPDAGEMLTDIVCTQDQKWRS